MEKLIKQTIYEKIFLFCLILYIKFQEDGDESMVQQ